MRDPKKARERAAEDAPEEMEEEDDEDEAGSSGQEDGWEEADEEELGEGELGQQVWRPGVDAMGEGEELDYDQSAYDCLHPFQLGEPCLSFDFLRDELGEGRTHFPHTVYLVAGSQADTAGSNVLSVARLTQLARTRRDPDDSDDSDDSDAEDASRQPVLHVRTIAHHGGINRVRAQPQAPHLVATWADTGHVQVWDVKPQLAALGGATAAEGGAPKLARCAPRQVFTGHTTEGYALDWSPVAAGRLLSGDGHGNVHLWEPAEGGRWAVGGAAYSGHSGASVEDLQWSPNEAGVFASAGCDGAVCVWDARQRARPALRCPVHDCDVNVLSWNRLSPAMLATGADDGGLRIWDLRHFAAGAYVAAFGHHTAAVTSVEWALFDSSTLATASADHTAAVWDLAVERDAEEEAAALAADSQSALPPAELPPQLMFVHQGQRDMKELHWHPQVPGLVVTTAADSFNCWKPENQGGEDRM